MALRTFSFVVSLLLITATVSNGQDPLSLDSLQARYERLDGLQATFTQIIHSNFSDDSTRIRGRVSFQGNKYRVETPSQTVVTNGKTTWIYSPADSQVVINTAEGRESRVTPQTFLTTSTEKYKIVSIREAKHNGAPHSIIDLKATKKSTRFTDVTLWVRRSDRLVTRLRATDRNGSTLDLRLHDITVNPSFEGSPFRFSPPEGVEVVDLRSGTTG